MKRTVTVLGSRRGEMYRTRSEGVGFKDEIRVTFQPTTNGTLLTYELQLALGWGPIGKLYQRRLGKAGVERKIEQEIDRFIEVAKRTAPDVRAGSLLSVDCGRRFRVVQMLASDTSVVHLRVLPGVSDHRPSSPADLSEASGVPDPLAIRALQPPLRAIGDDVTRGQPLLGLDGGAGIGHMALTKGSFADASPMPIEASPEPVARDLELEIEAWREVDGPVAGEDHDFGVAPLVSYQMDESRFGVGKVLRVDGLTVSMRFYSDSWETRPSNVNPWSLRLDPIWADTPGIGHMPMSAIVYGTIDAKFIKLAMIGQRELDGYRQWKESGGKRFGLGDVRGRPPQDEIVAS
jgi:hypothetical protein